jgi:hypothetical protein
MKINKTLVASDLTMAFTLVAAIPYDKDTLDLVNQIFPATWVPWIIKIGIGATLVLKLVGRWTAKETQVEG